LRVFRFAGQRFRAPRFAKEPRTSAVVSVSPRHQGEGRILALRAFIVCCQRSARARTGFDL